MLAAPLNRTVRRARGERSLTTDVREVQLLPPSVSARRRGKLVEFDVRARCAVPVSHPLRRALSIDPAHTKFTNPCCLQDPAQLSGITTDSTLSTFFSPFPYC